MTRLTFTRAARVLALAAAFLVTGATTPAAAEVAQIPDGPNDAYGAGLVAAPPGNEMFSDPTADILSGTFATGSAARSYSVSMEITGTPSPDYNYYVAGEFGSDCVLYHYLTPDRAAVANAFCKNGVEQVYVGSISGSRVEQRGSTLSATFKYHPARLPAELRVDPELRDLYAYTCLIEDGSRSCNANMIDWAEAPATTTFRI